MSRLAGPCLACPACGLRTISPDTPFLASQLVLAGSQLKYTPMPLAEQQIGDLTVELRATFLTKLKLRRVSFHSPLLSLGEGVLISEVKCAKPQSHYHCDITTLPQSLFPCTANVCEVKILKN